MNILLIAANILKHITTLNDTAVVVEIPKCNVAVVVC